MKTDVFAMLNLREARSIVEFRLEDILAELSGLQIRVCGCKDGAEKWAETVHKAIRELDSLHCLLEEMAKTENEMPKVMAGE